MQLAETRNKEDLNADYVNIETVVRSILNVLHFDLARINAVVDLNLQVTEINHNTAYLHSICYNLISNAVKYHAPGRTLNIIISTTAATNGLWLTVQDNGRGMDLSTQKQDVFKPFTRLTDEGEGKGVGLALVKSFVESNGGEIHLESNLDQGSTFKLLLRNYTLNAQQYELFE
jgi:signal transduction histidine kinase